MTVADVGRNSGGNDSWATEDLTGGRQQRIWPKVQQASGDSNHRPKQRRRCRSGDQGLADRGRLVVNALRRSFALMPPSCSIARKQYTLMMTTASSGFLAMAPALFQSIRPLKRCDLFTRPGENCLSLHVFVNICLR